MNELDAVEPEPEPESSAVPAGSAVTRYVGVTGLARFTATTGLRISSAIVRGSLGTVTEVVRQVGSGEPISEVVDHHVDALRGVIWRALGLARVPVGPPVPIRVQHDGPSLTDLREQGDELLRQLGDPQRKPRNEHPAFSRILRELLPDEARILRFMALAGPQPAIDVRTKTPMGVGSELVATGINLVAEMSGCTYPERNKQYLANLDRLGMIYFSDEQVEDPRRYSFVEAQPVASAAIVRAKRAHTVYRSIHITDFGLQFCEVCFTLDGYDAGGWLKDVR